MDSLTIAPTKSSPAIHFNVVDGVFEMTGKSCPENVIAFYEPIFKWLKEYFETGAPIVLNVKLTYFNTSSSKTLLDLFELLSSYHESSGKVMVNWFYEADDEDMLESGEEFSEDVSLPFTFLKMD